MLSLGNKLKELIDRVDGTQAVILADRDGLPIENYLHPETSVEVESLSAECNAIMARARDSISRLDFGKVNEISLVTEQYSLMCTFVGGEYFLILVLGRSTLLGKASFYMHRLAFLLRKDI